MLHRRYFLKKLCPLLVTTCDLLLVLEYAYLSNNFSYCYYNLLFRAVFPAAGLMDWSALLTNCSSRTTQRRYSQRMRSPYKFRDSLSANWRTKKK
jgi:hypothetical protein